MLTAITPQPATFLRGHFIAIVTAAAVALCSTFGLTVHAAGPLVTQQQINAAFANSAHIFHGTVVVEGSHWFDGGKPIPEGDVLALTEAYLKFAAEHIERFGVESSEPEAIAHREAWQESAMGARFMDAKFTGIRWITVRCDRLVKGVGVSPGTTLTVAWSTSILATCSHVMVPTDAGKQVTLFLSANWRDHLPILGERSYQVGTVDMQPQEDPRATARETESEPQSNSGPAEPVWPPNR